MENNEYDGPSPDDVQKAMKQLEMNQRVLDYDTKEFTVQLLVQKFTPRDGEQADIYVPPYQRNFNWPPQRQSRFIESLLIGLPIPFLFFADMPDARLEVVDGNQRLHTCQEFLANNLLLEGLDRIPELDGFRFRDLSRAQQRRFHNRTIRSVVLSQKATEEDRRDLFDRINTGSLIAEPVEIRRGARTGPVSDLIEQMAREPLFLRLCPMTETARKKREGEELITRFFAFGDGLDGYRDRVGEFLNQWLKNANSEATEQPELRDEYQQDFQRVMEFVGRHFPYGFAKKLRAGTTPRGRFDAIAIGALKAIREDDSILDSGPRIDPARWLQSDEFFMVTTSNAANVKSRIERRQDFVYHMLLGQSQEAYACAGVEG